MSAAMRSVLVVDDDGAVASLVAAVLRRDGITVDTAADGGQALRRLSESRYDAVLTDMTMPGMSGLQLVREACSRGHRPPFLVMSAFLDPGVERELRDDPGVTGILRKPFDIARLLGDVRAVLDRRGDAAPVVSPTPVAPPSSADAADAADAAARRHALAPLWLVRGRFPPPPASARPGRVAPAAADAGAC